MFNLYPNRVTQEQKQPAQSGNTVYKKRFGIIPAEPCRVSSMQTTVEAFCFGSTVSDAIELIAG